MLNILKSLLDLEFLYFKHKADLEPCISCQVVFVLYVASAKHSILLFQPVGPRKKRNLKKKKDPNAPKRPQSAYFLWLGDHRDSIKRDNPGISVTGISKKAGEMWRQVGDKTVS